MTNDADIVPDPTPDNLSRLSEALRDLEHRHRGHFDLTTRCGNLDLAFSPAGIDGYAGLSSRAVRFDLDGLPVKVASLDDVIRSKEAADRPRDRAALPVLYALREEIESRS